MIQDLSRCGNIAIPFDEQRNVENVARNTSFDAASEVKTHKNNFGWRERYKQHILWRCFWRKNRRTFSLEITIDVGVLQDYLTRWYKIVRCHLWSKTTLFCVVPLWVDVKNRREGATIFCDVTSSDVACKANKNQFRVQNPEHCSARPTQTLIFGKDGVQKYNLVLPSAEQFFRNVFKLIISESSCFKRCCNSVWRRLCCKKVHFGT